MECPSEKSSIRLQKRSGNIFVDRPMKVSPHRSFNSSKGVIRCRELEGMSEAEIKDELGEQGVTDVHRVYIKKGETKVPTSTLFVTFCMPTIPKVITVGYLRMNATRFVPSPLRCFHCHIFGHTSRFCKGEQTCVKCGKPAHEKDCVAHCVNCDDGHAATSKECLKWKLEAAIQKVRAEQNVPFRNARRIVEERSIYPSGPKSYAHVVSSSVKKSVVSCAEVQTELKWVGGIAPLTYSSSLWLNKEIPVRVKSAGTQASEIVFVMGDSAGPFNPAEKNTLKGSADPSKSASLGPKDPVISTPVGRAGSLPPKTGNPPKKDPHRFKIGGVSISSKDTAFLTAKALKKKKGKPSLPHGGSKNAENNLALSNSFASLEENMDN